MSQPTHHIYSPSLKYIKSDHTNVAETIKRAMEALNNHDSIDDAMQVLRVAAMIKDEDAAEILGE